jgi:prepilin-type N-terminal cleavage/methylation domain-containing protein
MRMRMYAIERLKDVRIDNCGSTASSSRPWHRGGRAFTLIELLVVIAIIGLLIAMLLPTLGRARMLARQTRELAAAKQTMAAFTLYANDNKGLVLPGYLPRTMVNTRMQVMDDIGEQVRGEEAQRYPWRLAPYFNFDFRGLYPEDKLLRELQGRRAEYPQYGVDYRYVVSLYPSLGMNVAFIGGSERHGGFDRNFLQLFGRRYIVRIEDAARPSQLIAFASARAEATEPVTDLGQPEGFFRVESPYFDRDSGRRWGTAYEASTTQPGENSGFVSLRYAGKGVVANLDSHAEMLGWDEVQDMRRWCDSATRPDWTIGN